MVESGMPEDKSKLVYSTDRAVPRKKKPDVRAGVPPSSRRVVVRLERKGRGGKSVTVVEGLYMPKDQKEDFVKQLKTRFGAGGTATDDGFEIQGDRRDAVMEALGKIGYSPKHSG